MQKTSLVSRGFFFLPIRNAWGPTSELTRAGRSPCHPGPRSCSPVGFHRGQFKIPWGIYRASLEQTAGKALEAAGELKVFVVV